MNKKDASLIRAQDEMDDVTREGTQEAGLRSSIKAVKRDAEALRRRENNAKQREAKELRRQERKAAVEERCKAAHERRQWREYDADRRAENPEIGRDV